MEGEAKIFERKDEDRHTDRQRGGGASERNEKQEEVNAMKESWKGCRRKVPKGNNARWREGERSNTRDKWNKERRERR